MISHVDKKLAQQIVNTVRDVCGQNINFIDTNGIIFASTDEKRIGSFHEIGLEVATTGDAREVSSSNQYTGTYQGVNLPVYHNGKIVAVIGITGEPEEVKKYAYLAERITKLLIREQELNAYARTESEKRNYIIQTLIHGGNVNYDYLFQCLSDIHIDKNEELKILLIQLNPRYNQANISMIERKITQLFQFCGFPLYTYQYPNEYIAVIENGSFQAYCKHLKEFASAYQNILSIGSGNAVSIYHLSDSYHSASIAIKSIRFHDSGFVDFDDLTLEMILGVLDSSVQEDYVKKTVSMLSKEDLELLQIYYEEDMSLANTCSRLYIHKNTLQYKLDRIHRMCGFNPRKFRDAVILYIGTKLNP